MAAISQTTPVSTLSGIGHSREAALASLGIFTLRDLLYHFPRAYQHRGNVVNAADAPDSTPSSMILTVATEPQVRLIRRGMSLLKFRAFDDSASVNVTFFNQDYLRTTFGTGLEFRFWGKIKREFGALNLASPQFEPYSDEKPLPEFVPVYPLAAALSQKLMASYIGAASKLLLPYLEDTLDEAVRLENDLCTLRFALENIHAPKNRGDLDRAIRRLAFDELYNFALSLTDARSRRKTGAAPAMTDVNTDKFTAALPYRLTSSQSSAVSDICADMAKPVPMSRILIGDVGCGKTVCAAAAAYVAVKNGFRAAIMAPTEILAAQHFNDLQPLFEPMGINIALLTGSTPAKVRKTVLESLKDDGQVSLGGIDIVVGTHALIEDNVQIDRLGLAVIDEQHRFGVAQREALANKSAQIGRTDGQLIKKTCHVLSLSATPIPRTLSLVIFGDSDVSQITDMPPGRQKVDTFTVDESYRSRLNTFIRKQTDAHNQVYIVCPAVEEVKADTSDENYGDVPLSFSAASVSGDDSNNAASQFTGGVQFTMADIGTAPPLKAAVTYAAELAVTFPDLEVGFIHGKLSGAEKDRIMERFVSGKTDVLVSTTVIEVGVNVPNATLMIVENAERFGLSQLHQLRGRVGRGSAKSYCVLVSDSKAEGALERLNTLKASNDGFAIAERDLAMRGPGDILASTAELKQHGDLKFRLADSCTDSSLIKAAFDAARKNASQR